MNNANWIISKRHICENKFHVCYHFFRYLWKDIRGEWPSELRRCNQNRKVPCSNHTRRSAGLRDPASLRGSRWPLDQACTNALINIGLVRLSPWEWPIVGLGIAKYQFENKNPRRKNLINPSCSKHPKIIN